MEYEEIDPGQMEEVAEVLKNLNKAQAFDYEPGQECAAGRAVVEESFFVATKRGIIWVVLFDYGFAYMKVSDAWIQVFGNIILLSPQITVAFDRHHRIVLWIAEQDKAIVEK